MLGVSTFLYEATDFGDRMGNVSGMMLTLFALLYVVGDTLPKRNKLSCIDKMVMATIVLLLAAAIESMVLCILQRIETEETQDESLTSQNLDLILFGASLGLFILAMVYYTMRAVKQASTALDQLRDSAAKIQSIKVVPKGSNLFDEKFQKQV